MARTRSAGGRWRRRRDDEGGAGVFALMCVPVLVACFGLVVDVGGRLEMESQVQWTADQAARAAGQRIDTWAAQSDGVPTTMDVAAAVAAAEEVVSLAGMTGEVTVSDGRVQIVVTGHSTPRSSRSRPRSRSTLPRGSPTAWAWTRAPADHDTDEASQTQSRQEPCRATWWAT